VLVTGGAGFIGSHIVDALLLRGHEVVVADDMSSGRIENIPAVRRWACNIARDEFFATVEGGGFDAICHQAAQPSLRRSLDDPAHDAAVNIVGTLNVIVAAKACGAHVVFASTSAVYDTANQEWPPFREDDDTIPVTPYGLAKLTAERYLELSGISHTILRYGNVYGPRQVQVGENQLVPHCLAHLLDGAPFVIHGDGQQTRDFVYVGDIARANVLAIEGRVQGTFNVGTGNGTSVSEVCAILANLCDKPRAFRLGAAKAGEARHVALDSSRARDVLGWVAQAPLTAGLRETVAWWRER
jgi:UDP-glucose 4-epimerase